MHIVYELHYHLESIQYIIHLLYNIAAILDSWKNGVHDRSFHMQISTIEQCSLEKPLKEK